MRCRSTISLACLGIFRGANVSTDAYGSLTIRARPTW
jgi:hypothetical protein